MTDEQWDAILDVHLKAPFRILRAAQPVIAAAAKHANQTDEPVRNQGRAPTCPASGPGPYATVTIT